MSLALSVVAPCLNEQDNVDELATRVLATLDGLPGAAAGSSELVLVDDGSRDGTWEAITRWSERDARVRGVRHPENRGIEAAWRSGLKEARCPLVCLIDSDLQNRPEDVAALYAAWSGDRDVVQGVRQPAAGMIRVAFSRGLNWLLNAVFAMRLRDSKSGFVLCRREVLEHVLTHRFRYRYFQSFVGVSAVTRGYRMVEVDTVFDLRKRGTSFLPRLPLRTSSRILWELCKFRVESLGERGKR